MFHKNMVLGDVHSIHSWSVADITARNALVLIADDIGKVAKVGASTFYVLANNIGPVWVLLSIPSLDDLSTSISNEAATAYTFALADANKYKRFTAATAVNATIPPESAVNFPIGTVLTINQAGAGAVVIAAGAGVTLNTPETLQVRKQKSTIYAIKVAMDVWDIGGDLL